MLTPEQEALKIEIQNAKSYIKAAEQVYIQRVKTCKHAFKLKHDPIYDDYGYAICEICNHNFGWSCSESPDKTCHYFSKDGKVTLIDGTTVDVESDEDYETEDCCIFCGQPEERK